MTVPKNFAIPDAQAIETHVVQAFEDLRLDSCKLLSTGRARWTACIKTKLASLGRAFDFSINASGCADAHEGEWLYDMTWSALDSSKHGMLIRQPLVLESEFKPDPIMDNDFHKLVQARAEVRVWVFTAATPADVESYVARCREQALAFAGSLHGDRYLLVGYEWEGRSMSIHTFRVSQADS